MSYKVMGNDGKVYGPVEADQVRQWIQQGRVDSRTTLWKEGEKDWCFAGLMPEFAGAFVPPPFKAPVPRGDNLCAVWSLVCGLLSWICCCFCLPFNLAGLVLGIIALAQLASSPEPRNGRAMAVAGVILSGLNLLACLGTSLISTRGNPVIWTGTFH